MRIRGAPRGNAFLNLTLEPAVDGLVLISSHIDGTLPSNLKLIHLANLNPILGGSLARCILKTLLQGQVFAHAFLHHCPLISRRFVGSPALLRVFKGAWFICGDDARLLRHLFIQLVSAYR